MEPRIQYAKTEDGVNIAYYALGEGPAIVRMPSIPWSHFQLQWQMFPEQRAAAELTAARFTFVEYDSRGTGSSARTATDFALDAHVLDLEAVVNKLGLDGFALIGQINSSPVAISYAVRNPQRISHLVLINGFARASDPSATPESQAFQALRSQDWTILSETIAQFQTGWSGEGARDLAAWLRESVSQEVAVASLQEIEKFDVTGILSQIRTPTLVTHQGMSNPPVEFSRSLAAQIPDARLVIAEDLQGQMIAIGQFLGIDAEPPPRRPPSSADVHTILFTDMASSTALAQQLGDAAAQEVRRAHDDIVRGALAANYGSEIKHTGDGIMASFSTASSALDAAIAIQRGVAEHKEANPDSPLAVYVGLNAGEPIAEDDDLFGTSINLAARICDHAEAGQILAANVVRELAAGKQFLFADLGETELRGFEDPVKLWELRWQEDN